MLQRYLPLLFVFGCILTGSAQIKIGENPQNIHPASVLELESNNRALVITRVSTAEMNAIVPLQGAMVYNNDTSCIHFYNGSEWLNLCDALGLSFSTDPVVNPAETIVITETDGNRNFEVGQITGMNIVDFSIAGVDLQNNSITANKLAANSVGSEELQDNTVTDAEIDYNVVTLNDFLNDANFITGADIVSPDPGNDISFSAGAFYDDAPLQTAISNNTSSISATNTNLSNHIAADGDLDDGNELQDLTSATFNPATNELTINIENGASTSVLLGDLANPGTDDQNLGPGSFNATTNTLTIGIEDGNPVNVDLSALAGTGSDDQDLGPSSFNPATNILTIGIEDGNATQVDLTALSATGSDNQDLNNVLGQGNDAGGQAILNIIDNPSPSSVVTKAYVDAQVSGGGSTELADQVTIVGDGTFGNEFRVADGAISSVKIADGEITTVDLADDAVANAKIQAQAVDATKIAPGAADQILRTDPTGTFVSWVNLPAGGNQDLSQVLTQGNDAGALQISNLLDPTLDQDAATKKYVDDAVVAAGGGVPTDELITAFQLIDPNTLRITEDAVDWDVDLDAVFATDAELAASTPDGSETVVTGSASVTVSGTGTTADPYVLTSTGGDGSETILSNNASITVSGTGTVADPYLLTADGSETIVNGSASVTVSGTGTTADPYILTSTGGDGSETLINGSSTVTVTGIGTSGSPYSLSVPTDGITTTQIDDGTIETVDISPGGDGTVLTSNGGAVSWQTPAASSTPIKAWGKAVGNFFLRGSGVSSITGATTGQYRINLVPNLGNTDYTILLSVQGDNRIYITGQANNTIDVEIRQNSDDTLVSANWHFTVIDN
ncbi:beta strand repeat-containing protein [Zeaxanthinibacter enoshimensis]|uniref:beta strand repeat-containing protein n=1 Tax=Zeaxanthinibacter enoshimensis TaxID=392009 RepID=UPI0035671F79